MSDKSVNNSSFENSSIVTPSLNPNEAALEIPTSPAKVILPVDWSTTKYLPTLKKPSLSELIKNTLPFLRSHTCALLASSADVYAPALEADPPSGAPNNTFG